MGIGLLNLVSIGKENIYLSTEPEITYFKIAYKRYSNFSTETIAQYFKTVPDFGRKVTVNISKTADLLGQIYLWVKLPDIITSNHSSLPPDVKKFGWNKKPGLSIIRYVDLEISGILIERNYGDWLNIWYELTTTLGKKKSFTKMIGDIDLLTDYSNGKKSYSLNIPLNFWFCQDSGLALPLVSMIHNDIKIHVEFNDFDLCFKQSPTHYINVNDTICLFKPNEIIQQTYNSNTVSGRFVYFDFVNQNIYYNKIKGDFVIPTSASQKIPIIGQESLYETNINVTTTVVKDESYFRFNNPSIIESYLLVNYIYLDNDERFKFLTKTHQYLIPVVQNIPEHVGYSTNIAYKIPFINPNKIIFWRCCLLSNINNNDSFNYTINEEPICEKSQIILNSVSRIGVTNNEIYTLLQNHMNNFVSSQNGINMYSFSLNPLEYQPSGTCNFSQIDDTYLQLTLNKKINYQNPVNIRAYGIQYNLFRIADGLGGLGYFL
jgi:hypothetical protein